MGKPGDSEGKGRRFSKARPVEGEELRQLLAEQGVESLEELDAKEARGEVAPGSHWSTAFVDWNEGEVGAEIERQLKQIGVGVGEPLVLAMDWPETEGSAPDRLLLRIVLRQNMDPHHEMSDLAVVYADERWRLLQERAED